MRILILGSDNFAEPLRALGCEAWTCAPEAGADLTLAALDPDWRQISELAYKNGFIPDAILVTDHIGGRRLPTGLWNAPAVTVFYGLDAPLNRFWQTPYARLFDLALLDQPQEARELTALHAGAHWLPVGVNPALYQGNGGAPPKAGACFVGVLDPVVRPKRSALLARAERICPLTVRGGRRDGWFPTERAAELYRSHQVVLNENLFPGLTTRPLEVMASGGCLLSEAAPGAMDRFFTDGEHLVYFDHHDFDQKLEALLKDAPLRRRLAQRGRELVRAQHGLKERAREIVKLIEDMSATPPAQRPRAAGGDALRLEGQALLMAGLRWPEKGGRLRVMRAAPRLEAAAVDGADPLPAARWAGLAGLVAGRERSALGRLARAADAGDPRDRLNWALAAFLAGQAEEADRVIAGLPGLEGRPGQARFHLAASRLLADQGRALGVGFNRRGLHPCFWTALEHLLHAVALEPKAAPAWEFMGDILLAGGAPNQARDAYGRARSLADGPELQRKCAEAAQRGYLS